MSPYDQKAQENREHLTPRKAGPVFISKHGTEIGVEMLSLITIR